MLAEKHTRNSRSFSAPSDHAARGVPTQDALARTPLGLKMMKAFPSRNGQWKWRQMISPMPSSIDLSTPPPMVTLLLDRSKVIIQPMKDGNGKRTFKLGPIVTMSCHPWDSNTKLNSPVPCMPCKQTPWQPTPGPSGTQWSEDLFHGKKPPFPFLILPFASSELTLPPIVEPSQHHEPPIPGLSQPSESHEDALAHEPEPEVAPMQFMEEPFG
ncbi:hypothetical protein O181_025578 [Austropuccinia psidii MF-1]|uniref:Uncharacterized protein n=1 Tax=Austropuccinia psidii MF-1 TaxID=1389203 RepID=A0A9Q3CN38_9BASI|nr:hypothetical protein [Austropuccinia psidii MF-1]